MIETGAEFPIGPNVRESGTIFNGSGNMSSVYQVPDGKCKWPADRHCGLGLAPLSLRGQEDTCKHVEDGDGCINHGQR
jgi:hypothetical protein